MKKIRAALAPLKKMRKAARVVLGPVKSPQIRWQKLFFCIGINAKPLIEATIFSILTWKMTDDPYGLVVYEEKIFRESAVGFEPLTVLTFGDGGDGGILVCTNIDGPFCRELRNGKQAVNAKDITNSSPFDDHDSPRFMKFS
jgi:hypothetical protein